MNNPITPAPAGNPQSILKEIAAIPYMERGKISVTRQTPQGPLYNHQTWEKGKNVARYLPRDQVAAVQEAIDGFQRFKQLTEDYAQQIICQTRADRAANVKKKPRLRSFSPRTRKSSS